MKWIARLVYRLVRAEVEAEAARAAASAEATARAYTNAAVSVGFQKSIDLMLEGARLAQKANEDLAGNVISINAALIGRIQALEEGDAAVRAIEEADRRGTLKKFH